MLPPLARTHTPETSDPTTLSRIINAIESAVAQALKPILGRPDMNDRIIAGVKLASLTTTVVQHKLGRALQEWQVFSPSGASTIYETGRTATTLTLFSTGAITCSLRVW